MKSTGKGKIVSQADLAQIFGVTSATVRAWRRAGCPAESEGGSGRPSTFNTADVIAWRLAGAAKVQGDDDVSLVDARRRRAVAQAHLAEMDAARQSGKLLPREDVTAAVIGAFSRVRTRLLVIPSKVAPLVAPMKAPKECEGTIRKAIYEALRELADTKIKGLTKAE